MDPAEWNFGGNHILRGFLPPCLVKEGNVDGWRLYHSDEEDDSEEGDKSPSPRGETEGEGAETDSPRSVKSGELGSKEDSETLSRLRKESKFVKTG